MNMIVAADKKNGIGFRGKLLVTIPYDQQLFRRETLGKVVVMGRKTLESLPGGRALEGRRNLVLTGDLQYRSKGAEVVHSVEEALKALEGEPEENIYVIGGESIYRQFLPYTDTIHMTKIDYSYEADTHFPQLPESEWELEEVSEEQTYFDLVYEFRRYRRRKNPS